MCVYTIPDGVKEKTIRKHRSRANVGYQSDSGLWYSINVTSTLCISLLFMLSYKFRQWNTRSPVDSIYLALTDLSEFQIFLLWAEWTLQLWGFFVFFLAAVAIYFLHWHLQFLPQKTSHSSASLWSALSCFFPPRKHKYSSYVIFVRVQVPSCVIILHISRWAPELSIEICAFFVSSYSLTLIFFCLVNLIPCLAIGCGGKNGQVDQYMWIYDDNSVNLSLE